MLKPFCQNLKQKIKSPKEPGRIYQRHALNARDLMVNPIQASMQGLEKDYRRCVGV